jgi:O-antigen/teichoic acid export membrane protein
MYEAEGNASSLRSLYINGTRATMAVSLPIALTLIIRGDSFIGVWMGPQYSKSSGTVLAILATALLFSLQNVTAASIAFGVGKHKTLAKWAIGEAVSNLTLSIILAHVLGIYGVAIGTLIPSLVVQLVLWPRYISELVGIRAFDVIWKVVAPVLLSTVPFALASYAVDVHFPVHNKATFFMQTLALLPIFVLTVGLMFRENVKRQVLPRVKLFLGRYKVDKMTS